MPTTDTSEAGLESLIVAALTGLPTAQITSGAPIHEAPVPYATAGYLLGNAADYDRDYGVDVVQLLAFLEATQPSVLAQLGIGEDGPNRRKFLARLQGEISKRGVVDVLRRGISHYPANAITLFYGTPSPGNVQAATRFQANRFSITRQLHYSRDESPPGAGSLSLYQRPACGNL